VDLTSAQNHINGALALALTLFHFHVFMSCMEHRIVSIATRCYGNEIKQAHNP